MVGKLVRIVLGDVGEEVEEWAYSEHGDEALEVEEWALDDLGSRSSSSR